MAEDDARPLADSLRGDPEIAAHFAATAEIRALLRFEAVLAMAQGSLGVIAGEAASAIAVAAENLSPSMDAIRRGMARDGVPVPALVRQLRAAVGEPHGAGVHLGATSQDAVDTGLMLRLKAVLAVLDDRLARLIELLGDLAAEQGAVPLMAQTRMQAALSFTAADKLDTWSRPLASHRERLAALATRLPIQLGGPIGTGSSFGASYPALRTAMAGDLGLADAEPWHSDRTAILDVAQGFALVVGTLGKLGQDAALMAQTRVGALRLAGGGASSAMAHKQNPIGAEVLVALARFSAGVAGTLAQSMVHENERSGAAWTLEWLVLPQMAETAGAALSTATALLQGAAFVSA